MAGASSDEAGPDGRPRRFRWWMPIAAVGGVVLVGVVALLVLFVVRDQPDAKPVEEVLEEFESASTTSAAGGEADTLRPPAGVYLLEGEGREAISFPPVSQEDGAVMPATVEHLPGGCWVFTVNYNEAHWQEWTLCPGEGSPSGLVETSSRTYQAWDFGATEVTNISTFECDPPTPFLVADGEPGETWTRRCVGTNDQVAGETVNEGPLTFMGSETLEVGGESVEALHVRQRHTITGAQTGESDNHFWFAAADAMPLRGERDVRVDSDSPVGSITYTEEGTWQLSSLEPES